MQPSVIDTTVVSATRFFPLLLSSRILRMLVNECLKQNSRHAGGREAGEGAAEHGSEAKS